MDEARVDVVKFIIAPLLACVLLDKTSNYHNRSLSIILLDNHFKVISILVEIH